LQAVNVRCKVGASVAQLEVNYILLHSYSHIATASRCASTNKNLIIYLENWHKRIFDFKLRTIEAENP